MVEYFIFAFLTAFVFSITMCLDEMCKEYKRI